MKRWLCAIFLCPLFATASVPEQLIELGKKENGNELFILKDSISYQKMVLTNIDKNISPTLTYNVLENIAKPNQSKVLKSIVHTFIVECPINKQTKAPFQGGFSAGFSKINANGKRVTVAKGNQAFSIDTPMVTKSHVTVCEYVEKHNIPVKEIKL
ncbi:hypothetical protein [Moraxella sp. ZY210820]|uniref:hypothetical protein n=1 Tax=unclassified Moraxella TaxID=2685852 RepID=UPI00273178DA|nr:hypothetical protein [Moraxella sp. ZY210820]WLF83913.1 hypothetical protein LU301_11905 [Moraxella sp. ZY210820]